MAVFFILWIGLSLPLWTKTCSQRALQNMHGEWVDTAFSDILSERYDGPIKVSKVYFHSWSEIHFDSIEIRSKAGRDLIYGAQGSFKLKYMELKKLALFETEINLKDVYFTKEYYKDSPALKKWGSLMHKPIGVKRLRLKIVQNPEFIKLSIMDCQSDMLNLEGSLVMDKAGKVRDRVKISYNPWALLRTAF